ncbi:DEAD (Asp-Glu-Ala-Asp) box polypeptide 59 [Actinomortierella ambigua]|uniref:RNA helicase n=1 Tax=Actinomortierella ambigua TaxID=1343610 RepID=A0A9P6PU28_9FUNG|nr:DEAD (Asp-Glu-Ala-Asp) box polypeptide 59 [Actinomortierella ambigua]
MPSVAAMSAQEVQQLQEKHKIQVQAKHAPKPILSFDDCGLPPTMHINILGSGCYEPTPVQMQAIPAGLLGQDVVIAAPTRSGKTAAYLIPTLVHAYGLAQVYSKQTLSARSTMETTEGDDDQGPSPSAHQGPYVLVLVPTHELAAQVEEQAKVFVKGLPHMRTANLSGGLGIKNQVYRLKQNVQVAIATPGRLIEILFRFPEVSFSNVYSIVLDEVDMMYSLGFDQQVQRILDVIPEPTGGRQTIVCSATFPKKTENSIRGILHHPVRIRVGDPVVSEEGSAPVGNEHHGDFVTDSSGDSSGLVPTASVRQTIMWVENASKKKTLFSILRDRKYFHPPILVFVDSRLGAELLAKAIAIKCPGVKAASMHGENTPAERLATLSAFKDGSVQVMVATGLLARGLDLRVPLVINFDMAPTIEEQSECKRSSCSGSATAAWRQRATEDWADDGWDGMGDHVRQS